MIRPALCFAAFALLPALAGAQVYKCPDPATGKMIFTDQKCDDGKLAVPARTEEQIRQDNEAAAQANKDTQRREQASEALERQRAQAEQAQTAARQRASASQPSPAAGAAGQRSPAWLRDYCRGQVVTADGSQGKLKTSGDPICR